MSDWTIIRVKFDGSITVDPYDSANPDPETRPLWDAGTNPREHWFMLVDSPHLRVAEWRGPKRYDWSRFEMIIHRNLLDG